MDDADHFRTALWTFVGRQSSKTAAASALNVTRQDLYRYLAGETVPRPERLERMLGKMTAGAPRPPYGCDEFPSMTEENVTKMRDMLLHLVSLLDLDLASRRVNERKGG